jgi:hypothetical protein
MRQCRGRAPHLKLKHGKYVKECVRAQVVGSEGRGKNGTEFEIKDMANILRDVLTWAMKLYFRTISLSGKKGAGVVWNGEVRGIEVMTNILEAAKYKTVLPLDLLLLRGFL